MAQINLLKQNRNYSFLDLVPKILVRFFVLILLALIGYYVWLLVDLRNKENTILATQQKISLDQQEASNIPNRKELFIRQQQLNQLSGLIGNHPYWSKLFPELARVTLKVASYSSLRVGSGGEVDMTATVPSLPDLAKYMQVFDQDQFNKNFTDIQIGGFTKSQGQTSTLIQFSVRMKFNPELIKYSAPEQLRN